MTELEALRIARRKTLQMRDKHHELAETFKGAPIAQVFVDLFLECDQADAVLAGMIEVRDPDWKLNKAEEREEHTEL